MPSRQGWLTGGVIAGYVLAALTFAWPLPLHLATHLTGAADGDTGIYVWNQWVFRHEVVEHRSLPYVTDSIFSLTGAANLSLHNFTPFQNLVALPLIGWLGVVGAFNVVYLTLSVLTGYMMFLLARQVTGRVPESYLAGLLFAWSPVLVTRGTGHFSLAAAAPLAAFLLMLVRTAERQRSRDAALLGLTFWWAASTDAYFAIYCLLLALLFLVSRVATAQRSQTPERRPVPRMLDVLLWSAAATVLGLAISGGGQFTIFTRVVRVRGLYTPVLLLTALALIRAGWTYRVQVATVDRNAAWRVAGLAAIATSLAAVLLSPVLYALVMRIASGKYEPTRTFWRSSPPGIDLMALLLPNPNHPLSPAAITQWLTARPEAYIENVASLPLVAAAVMIIAWRAGWRVPRLWAGIATCFGLLALGPFVHVAGLNTYVPGPWALLRYVPIVDMARTPTRFSIVVALAFAVLFALALSWLTARYPERRRPLLAAVAVLIAFELWPLPRPLWSAAIPAIYQHVAAAPADARLLELPFGVRDGTSSIGDFTARSQYYQTYHQKRLIGGYLSRVSQKTIWDIRKVDMLDALITLSEGARLDPMVAQRLVHDGAEFVDRAGLAFVVIDCARTTPALREFALHAFQLELVDRDGDLELYRPAAADPHPRRVSSECRTAART